MFVVFYDVYAQRDGNHQIEVETLAEGYLKILIICDATGCHNP
jgi:hypothetical protein